MTAIVNTAPISAVNLRLIVHLSGLKAQRLGKGLNSRRFECRMKFPATGCKKFEWLHHLGFYSYFIARGNMGRQVPLPCRPTVKTWDQFRDPSRKGPHLLGATAAPFGAGSGTFLLG